MTGWNANPEDDDRRAKPLLRCVGCGTGIARGVRCGPCSADNQQAMKRERDRRRRERERGEA